jgi:choline-sulfatase
MPAGLDRHSVPNILWICTDQQRHDTLGTYGNRHVATPNLDKLAAGGTLFENAFCQSPVCTPSRASFMTGRYPRTTRTRANGQSIPEDEVPVTKLLRDGGNYTCGLSGKLHLSACQPKVCPDTERRIDDGYADEHFHWSHHPDCEWPGNEYCQWLAERGETYKVNPHPISRHVQTSMPEESHQTTWCAEKAIEFMERQKEAGPWAFSVNIFDPHHRFDPPAEYLENYLDRLDELPMPHFVPGELSDKPTWQRMDHARGAHNGGGAGWDQHTEQDHRALRAAYFAMVDLIDVQVGRMVDALDRTGQRENTLVIFMSDHGEMLGDHGIYLKGPYCYEEGVHVPLIASMPGTVAAGVRRSALVELIDLAPTLLDAAGLPNYPGIQGKSLWPLLTDAAAEDVHRDDVYCEYYEAMPWHDREATGAPWLTMLRTTTHKLVAAHNAGVDGELYDLAADPHETRNLWHDPTHAAVKLDLYQRLADRMAFTTDPLPERKAAF